MFAADSWFVRLATAASLSGCTSDLPTDPANLECDRNRNPPCVRGYVCWSGLCVHPSQLADGGLGELDAAVAQTSPIIPQPTSERNEAIPSGRSAPPPARPGEPPNPDADRPDDRSSDSGALETHTADPSSTADVATAAGETSTTDSNPARDGFVDDLESSAGSSNQDPATTPTGDAGVSDEEPGTSFEGGTTHNDGSPPSNGTSGADRDDTSNHDSSDEQGTTTSESDATSETTDEEDTSSTTDAGADEPTDGELESCSEACAAPPRGTASCVDGFCRITCNDGLELCNQECVNLQNDRQHCGTCGNQCNLACIAGICLL